MTPTSSLPPNSTRSSGCSAEGAGLEPDPWLSDRLGVIQLQAPACVTLLSAMLAVEIASKGGHYCIGTVN